MATPAAAPNSPLQTHIGIVGAGVSGLRCADLLVEKGFQVTILEARDRIGGKSDGEGRHPLLELAAKTNTPLHHWNTKQNIYSPAGDLLSDEKADKFSSLLWEVIAEAQAYSAANKESIPEDKSLYDFVVERSQAIFPDSKEDAQLLCQMSEMWGAYIGEPVQRQSLRFVWMEEVCGGEEMFIETNYGAILAAIAKTAVEKAVIKLNTEIVAVESVERETGGAKVKIVTRSGDDLYFDEVIMTTPLGWLKRNKHIFTPRLPPRMSDGIDGISVGHLEKVYITFPDAFWVDTPPVTDSSVLSSSSRLARAEDTFAGYTNWLSPTYAPEQNPSQWPQEIWNLASFSPLNRRPTILFYTYGPCSSHLCSLLANLALPERHTALTSFFEPYYSLLPNYDSSSPDCVPKATLATTWQLDKFAGFGSYCNVQVGSKQADQDIEAMRHGVPERKLWFCGEHTSPNEELGTVAGAYLSAERVVGRILEIYGQGELIFS